MLRRIGTLSTLAALAWLAAPGASPAAGLGEAMELEHARANARAGGPVSARDRELLERYGCLSGTNSPACGPSHTYRGYEESPPRKWKRKWSRRY